MITAPTSAKALPNPARKLTDNKLLDSFNKVRIIPILPTPIDLKYSLYSYKYIFIDSIDRIVRCTSCCFGSPSGSLAFFNFSGCLICEEHYFTNTANHCW